MEARLNEIKVKGEKNKKEGKIYGRLDHWLRFRKQSSVLNLQGMVLVGLGGWSGTRYRAVGKAGTTEGAMKMRRSLHPSEKAGSQCWPYSSLQRGGQKPTVSEHPLCALS